MPKFNLRYHSFLIAIAFSLLSACNEPEPVVLYTYKSGDTCSCGGPFENLIYASDESGNILDVKSFKSNETVQLVTNNTMVPSRINITIAYYQKGGRYTTLSTSLGVSTAPAKEVEETKPSALPKSTGSIRFVVNNYPGIDARDFLMSNDFNLGYTQVVNNQLSTDVSVSDDTPTVFATTLKGGSWVYYEKNIKTDKSGIIINYNTDFKPMHNKIVLDYPPGDYHAYVDGYRRSEASPNLLRVNNQSHRNGLQGDSNPFELGYNNGYDLYYTNISIGDYPPSKVNKTYTKYGGPPPAVIPFLDYTLEVRDNNINNFDFTVSGPYETRSGLWSYAVSNIYLYWNVTSPPDGKQNLQKVLDDYAARHPDLQFDKLTRTQTTFSLSKGTGGPYFLTVPANGILANKEFFSITFRNN